MSKLLACTALAFVLATEPVMAEQLMRLPPGQRLNHGEPDANETSQNVTITSVGIANVPDFIKDRINAMVFSCTGDADQINNVHSYAWSSDRHTNSNLSPNYIIDFGAVQTKAGTPACAEGGVCDSEGCLVYGYTPIEGRDVWRQDFELRATKISFDATNGGDDTKHRTQIQVLSNKDKCADAGGLDTNQGCYRKFEWQNFGLHPVSPTE